VEANGNMGRTFVGETLWIVPYLNFPVRWERVRFYDTIERGRVYLQDERHDLVSARQHAIAARTG
jgi:hypothetical protein